MNMVKVSVFVAVIALVSVEAFSSIAREIHAPKPYAFGYTVKDKHGEQHRQETGDGAGVVKGSYGFTDDRGIHRQVNYVADKAGFHAEVKTNEHGTAPQHPAAVKMLSSAHPYLGGAGGIKVPGLPFAASIAGPFSSGNGPLSAGVLPPYVGTAPLAARNVAVVPLAETTNLARKNIAVRYGEPHLVGAVKGYDSRFGVY